MHFLKYFFIIMSATVTIKNTKGEEKKVRLNLMDKISKAKTKSGEVGATWKFGESVLDDNKKVWIIIWKMEM